MKFSSKKFIPFLIIILFIFFCFADFIFATACDPPCPKGQRCQGGKCVRSLEVEYPKIPGVPEVIDFNLPNYVVYVFYLSVILIGLVVFTMIVYHGIRYLIAIDKPAVLKDAIDGILKAFLGAIILLSAVLIFRTINPQLVIFELGKIRPLGAIITPGIYVCNYQAGNIKKALDDYINVDEENIEKQIEAAKELRKIMRPNDKKNRCLKANFSGNFENFALEKNDTMFIIPKVVRTREGGQIKWKPIYEYGIVLHENQGFRGQCQYYPEENNNLLYTVGETTHQIEGYSPGARLPFDRARSFTIFKKPTKGPVPDDEGVTLYNCFDYNKTKALCPKEVVSPASKVCRPGGDADIIFCNYNHLKDIVGNTRSITVDPKDRYFAIVYTEQGEGECAIVTRNDPDILDMKLPFCSANGSNDCTGVYGALRRAWHWITFWSKEQDVCVPCIKSMRVIKGKIL